MPASLNQANVERDQASRTRSRKQPVRRQLFAGFVWSLVLSLGLIASAQAKTPFIDPMFEFTVERDIVFAKGDIGHPEKTGEMDMTLDLYRPVATAELPETLPAMIFVFGGGYKKGSKSIGYIRDLCEYYARRGYVAASISYRLIKHNPSGVQHPVQAPPELRALGFSSNRFNQADLSQIVRVVNAALQDTGTPFAGSKSMPPIIRLTLIALVSGVCLPGHSMPCMRGTRKPRCLAPMPKSQRFSV